MHSTSFQNETENLVSHEDKAQTSAQWSSPKRGNIHIRDYFNTFGISSGADLVEIMDEEEESASLDLWSDMMRSDACTADETFHIMEQNIHKQFQASSKRIKSTDKDIISFNALDVHSIPHRKSDRGRVRTISSINGILCHITL